MSRKRLSLFMVVGVLVLLVSLSAIASAQTVLRVGMQDWGDTFGRQVFEEQLIPKFEAAHPGVTVEVIWTPWNTYGSQYAVWYAGGVMPDVISIGSAGLGSFAAQGMIQSLDRFAQSWSGLEDMAPPAIQDGMINGELYSIGYLLDVRPLLYNTRMFAEAGLPVAAPEDWDQLREYARRLVRKDTNGAITREGFDVRTDVQHALPFIFQNGGAFISDDGTLLLADDAVVEALEFMQDLIYEDQVSTPGGSSFVRGASAMVYEAAWHMVPSLNPSLEDLAVGLPRQVNQTTQVHINKFAISSTSQHPELAWEWIAFIMEPENLALVTSNSPRLTSRLTTLEYAPFSEDPRWHDWMNVAVQATALPGYLAEFTPIMQELNKAVGDVLRSPIPVRTRLEEMVSYLNAAVMGD